jgi:hypothetical protein
MADKNIEAFCIMVGWEGSISKTMLDVFMELDMFFDKMEAQRIDEEMKEEKRKNGR